MSALLWRALFAVIVVVILGAAVPLFLRVVGFEVSADVITLCRLIIAGLAVLYVIWGKTPRSPVP